MMDLEKHRIRSRLGMAKLRAGNSAFREKGKEYSRLYHWNHREEVRLQKRIRRLKYEYGLTLAEFESILKSQNGLCAICGVLMTASAKASKNSLAVTVDHCHTTGKVRGLLCYTCNLALGLFKDSAKTLRSAMSYMEKHSSTAPPVVPTPA